MNRMAPLLALALSAPAFAREAKAPVRPAGGPSVVPVVAPSLPVSPAASAGGLVQDLLRLAGRSIGVAPGALSFAPGSDSPAPPSLPNSAMQASEGLSPRAASPQAPGLSPQAAQPGRIDAGASGLASTPGARRSRDGGPARMPDIVPADFHTTPGMPAVSQRARTLAEKSAALEAPLKAATGLASVGPAADGERARGLADGIWDVMTDARAAARGGLAEGELRDALNANAMSNKSAQDGALPRAAIGSPDLEQLLDYSGLNAAHAGAAAADAGRSFARAAGAFEAAAFSAAASAPGRDFLAEAVDAAETARRYAREEQASERAADAGRAQKPFAGPVERLWLETVDSVVRFLSLGAADGKLRPGWSAEGGEARSGARRGAFARGSEAAYASDGGSLAYVRGASGERLVSRLAARSTPPASVAAPGFVEPRAKSVPDELLVLSLLPLLAAALAYLREFRR